MTILKKICRDRRGVAIEMALLVMIVTFSLGALMVTVAILQNNSVASIKNSFEKKLELEQLGEDFCNKLNTDRASIEEFTSDKYDVSVDTERLVLVAREKDSGNIAMTIDIDEVGTGGAYEIVEWEIK